MGGVFAAFLVTSGIIVYRWATGPHEAPPPAAFGGAAVVFAAAGLLAQADKKLGTATAWAFTTGALLVPASQWGKLGTTGSKLAGVPPSTVIPQLGHVPTGPVTAKPVNPLDPIGLLDRPGAGPPSSSRGPGLFGY